MKQRRKICTMRSNNILQFCRFRKRDRDTVTLILYMFSEISDTNKCELPSKKYYNDFDNTTETTKFVSNCNTNEKLLSKYPAIKEYCLKFAANIENLKNKVESNNMEKEFTYSKHWMRHNVISTVKGNISINFIMFLYKVRNDILENHKIFNINECMTNVTLVSVDDFLKWKKMYDYMDNYKKLECTFQKKQECEEYCNEACNDDYKENYCEETYIEQYESLHTFSFLEKLIGYSIKTILSKSLYYSKYILSLFGSKTSPPFDNLRKIWRNVQGVTNPATLLNPMKPPGGGNKMGLPYLPK
ncbi:PIR Superfamily Protein [Plasmodium ovale wallikeri]|uniref:PIR Superfamily Protein n=1 Tax=Plasmodium ovale wallikeri TaxID=864142 RepID=A0A1A8YTA7_PLAOA|nr:PIR Superfamily Protein [Plasmodium ovale wallikeri]